MKKQKGYATSVQLITVIFVILGLIGWVMNVVMIYHSNFSVIDGKLVVRLLGIVIVPLGAVLGYL